MTMNGNMSRMHYTKIKLLTEKCIQALKDDFGVLKFGYLHELKEKIPLALAFVFC